MNIIVCIKQVPDSTQVEIDAEKGILKREGVDSKLNVYDTHALEAGVRIKEECGGKVSVISMGPPQAEAVIREAFTLGADEGYLLTDRAFAGADTLATSYTLSQGIRKIGNFDLILCGMQTTDGDTAQVGPGIAEMLEIPHASYVKLIREIDDTHVTVDIDMHESIEKIRIKLPCLLTVTRDANQPRLPSLRKKLATQNREITIWSSRDLEGADEAYFGLDGSPTRVERIFPPSSEVEKELWEDQPQVVAAKMYGKLKELKFI